MKLAPLSLLFLVVFIFETNADKKCHTCLGRDLDNCLLGDVSCKHGCMKVVDTKHSVVAKGCKGEVRQSVINGEQITLSEVTLPWDKEEAVSGTAYFCENADFCNAASSLPLSLSVIFGALFMIFVRFL